MIVPFAVASLFVSLQPQLQGDDWVRSERVLSALDVGVGPGVRGYLGWALAPLHDLDGDGIDELVIGSPTETAGAVGPRRRALTGPGPTPFLGTIRVLFLDATGSPKAVQRITAPPGSDYFGWSVTALPDLDGDGLDELAVGDPADSTVASLQGAVWILFLNPDGSVRARQKINEVEGGFGAPLGPWGGFGTAVASVGDLDGDGVGDLAVGEGWDTETIDWECTQYGSAWILFLNPDGTVKAQQRIGQEDLDPSIVGHGQVCAYFGSSMAALGDLDGDGLGDLAIGMPGTGPFGTEEPCVWILFLQSDGLPSVAQRIDRTHGGFHGGSSYPDGFALSLGACGDLDRDGATELAVSTAESDEGGCCSRGAFWILFLEPDGTVLRQHRIGQGLGGFDGPLADQGHFGASVAGLGDVDGDGLLDLAVGAPSESWTRDPGSLWILSLERVRRLRR